MICEKCGAQLPENAKFCLECGTPVTYPEAKPETTTSVFDELQVEEIDSDNFFGQFDNAPVEEVMLKKALLFKQKKFQIHLQSLQM